MFDVKYKINVKFNNYKFKLPNKNFFRKTLHNEIEYHTVK